MGATLNPGQVVGQVVRRVVKRSEYCAFCLRTACTPAFPHLFVCAFLKPQLDLAR